jgi:hypothetical protein
MSAPAPQPAEPGYQSGFGNEFATEALPGALPQGRNSPQRCPYGLYAEQISGTAFTAPRADNRRSWLYRIRPAAVHAPFKRIADGALVGAFGAAGGLETSPNQLRWSPLPLPQAPTDFIDGLFTMAGNGDPASQSGCAIHLYAANRSMRDRFFFNADAEMLIVPQQGALTLRTELGLISLEPQQIAIIPRGIRFCVDLSDEAGSGVRGYVCENFGAPLRLPVWELLAPGGPLGPAAFSGRLEAGTLRAGMRCVLVPSGATCTVKAVDRGEGGGGGPPAPGEEVRVGLSGLGDPAALAPGQLLCPARQPCCAARRLRLRLSALASLRVPLLRGSSCVLHVAGQREEATVTRLLEQLDPRTGEVLKPRPRCLARGACGRVELSLAPGRCIAAEAFAECRPLGRAVLRDGGATLALGVVERVWSEAEAAEEAAEAAAAAEAAGEGR